MDGAAIKQGWQAFAAGRHGEAVAIGEKLLRKNRRNVEALHLVGSVEMSQGALESATERLMEPLSEEELARAFKSMDASRNGSIAFDDFLAWYTLAHSSSGILSKKGASAALDPLTSGSSPFSCCDVR